MLGKPTRDSSGYEANATPDTERDPADRVPPRSFKGDTYVTAMGRFDDLPPPVAAMANSTVRNGGNVTFGLQFDADEQYIGYRVTLIDAARNRKYVDVAGAASRFVRSQVSEDDQVRLDAAAKHDAPPESGVFGGGYGPSSTQALRYHSDTISRPYRFEQPVAGNSGDPTP